MFSRRSTGPIASLFGLKDLSPDPSPKRGGAGFACTERRAASGGTMNSPDEVWPLPVSGRGPGG
uniref:Uncharacterized protein n=2 Tax=Candidatus Bipolaricaulota TaxID=67810 RepID=H5SJC6_9BACT|nr:hypothetical protein HGMM_F35G12C33 [uncultured Acetothermia bacterium]BAL58997.1 hypothetical protein HGMM_OP3C152 [Candidatus Acetothermum autotrophicum]